MNEEKYYCSECDNDVSTEIKTITEEYEVKGEKVSVESNVRVCLNCGEQLFDFNLDDVNLTKVYNAYRKKHGLLLPEDIKRIRSKYALSQSAFAKILGFGAKTITRYENGALQDKAQNNLIMLMEDNRIFEKIWMYNKNILLSQEIEKTEQALDKMHKNVILQLVPSISYSLQSTTYSYASLEKEEKEYDCDFATN